MRLPRIIIVTALLAWTGLAPVHASSLSASKDSAKVRTGKWSGNVELVSGFGFLDWGKMTWENTHLREAGTLNLLYDSPTFQFNTSLGSRFEKNFTTKERLIQIRFHQCRGQMASEQQEHIFRWSQLQPRLGRSSQLQCRFHSWQHHIR